MDAMSRWPVVGPWLVEADTARWAKVLGAPLGNKVPLMRGLELAHGPATAAAPRPHGRGHPRCVEVPRSPTRWRTTMQLTATGYNLVRVGERPASSASMLDHWPACMKRPAATA